MAKDTLVTLDDPISRTRKVQDSPFNRLLKTKHFRGKGVTPTDEFGHYLFCGKQRSGKTVSMIWFRDLLTKKYTKRGFDVVCFSNMGFGYPVNKFTLHDTLVKIAYDPKKVYIFCIDEIQAYFPKDTKNSGLLALIDQLTGDFSQLGKRQIYILSTAQVYGRLNKNLREQCLYMVACRKSRLTNRIVNDFIPGDDIMCDELGRWSGIPSKIFVHGLPATKFDTHRLITE